MLQEKLSTLSLNSDSAKEGNTRRSTAHMLGKKPWQPILRQTKKIRARVLARSAVVARMQDRLE